MATLFDKLSSQQPAQLPVNNQSKIEQLLAAKSGKLGAAPAVASSNIGEQAVNDQANAALKQGAMTGALQGAAQNVQRQGLEQQISQAGAEQQQQYNLQKQNMTADQGRNLKQLAGQESMQLQELDAAKQRKLKGISAQAESQLRALSAQGQMEVDDIFADFARSNQELAFRKDAAQLEQLGTLLALQDRKYIDELNRIGEQRRLYDRVNWDKEKSRIIYGENLNNLMNELQFKRGEDIANRDYQRQLAALDIDTAIAMAQATMRDEAQRQMWEAGISATSTAAGADWDKILATTPNSDAFAPTLPTSPAATNTTTFDVTGSQFPVTR